jgi:ribosomal protein L40E
LLSDDPEVLSLTREGFEPFLMRTAERIFNAHQKEIVLNCCPKCGALLAKTPKARQCRFCRYDWH